MKLVVREYLALMKEDGEFDALISDLSFAMGRVPVSKPQKGVRQSGVDVAAIGRDEQGNNCLFLYVLKVGDIGRDLWDGNPTAIRSSLDEILDVYLRSHVPPKYQNYKKIIILGTTGILKQEIQPNWAGYTAGKTVSGSIEFEEWSGDKVAELVERHLLNEYLLPSSSRSDFRKSLSLVGEGEYDLEHFYKILTHLFDLSLDGSAKAETARRKRLIRGFKTANLMLLVLFRWAESDNNLRNAFFAAERSILWAWDVIRELGVFSDKKMIEGFARLYQSYQTIAAAYFSKIQPHYFVRDGVSIYSGESAIITEQLFEQMGILASIGLSLLKPRDGNKQTEADVVADALEALLHNNPSTGSPCYDGHMIEIGLVLLLFVATNRVDTAKAWLTEVCGRLIYSFQSDQGFPICSDSFDDLMSLRIEPTDELRKEMKSLSTLVPMLVQWCAGLEMTDLYNGFISQKDKIFKDMCMQLWHPDENTEKVLYKEAAQYRSGAMEAPIFFPQALPEMREQIGKLLASKHNMKFDQISAVAHGIPALVFIANRHFRTPVFPFCFQSFCSPKDSVPSIDEGKDNDESART